MDTPNIPIPQSPMCLLQERWYHSLAASLLQSPAMFQLAQPGRPLASDEQLWSSPNIVPPRALTFNSVLRRTERFFDEYAAVAGQITFPASQFSSDIGQAHYVAWSAYVDSLSPTPPLANLPALFRMWAMRNGATAVAAQGIADLTQMALIAAAKQALEPYQGNHPRPVDYAGSLADLQRMLASSPPAQLSFDSAASPPPIPAWARDNDDYLFGLWSGSDPRSRINQRFALAQVRVDVDLGAYAPWVATAGPWYDSALLHNAYANDAAPPWTSGGSPGWGDMFGPFGALRRAIASLLVADGADIVVLCNGMFNRQDQARIRDNAARGLWPFYLPSGPSTSNTVSFDGHGHLTLTTRLQPGQPFVIGANVLDMPSFLGYEKSASSD
ncbi:hypothetical protein [Janthinobacterium fluminis]|uniref:DUF2272 domain-containing protein n=1 Tax=Janthinobacterium fluminis TaxID=2987524 RepID=A0ABT5JW45_9BURK|nr:hypothetical protein [Janthinobacterium fluminis]MDC8756952.1 hypothetical protein [Janthinobacterium fluminis]